MLVTTVVIESANCQSSGRFVVRNCWLALRNCHRNLPIQIVIQDHSSSPLEQSWKYLAKQLNSMDCRTIPFVQFGLWQKCLTLIGKNWGKTLFFSYFDLVSCVLGWFCQKYLLYTRGLFELLSQFCKLHFTHPASSCSAHPWNWELKFKQNIISNNLTTEPGIQYLNLKLLFPKLNINIFSNLSFIITQSRQY